MCRKQPLGNQIGASNLPFPLLALVSALQDICSLVRQMLLGQFGWIDLPDLISHTKSSISAIARKKVKHWDGNSISSLDTFWM